MAIKERIKWFIGGFITYFILKSILDSLGIDSIFIGITALVVMVAIIIIPLVRYIIQNCKKSDG
ncbi:hypothetical protein [uncultured Clostridium sp.]|uniref:hypothetical protein n=1 Tax=uncultured Clostridium sp. TaxID=59620 RepID=UPI0028EEB3C1|nr:hypothetical protein [uncultured Clostridium sp.]